MKRLVYLAFALFVVACAGNGGGNGNVVAVTPADFRCINGTTVCNSAGYANYSGWTTYSFPYGNNTNFNYINYFNQYGFCGCPSGFVPAYNGTLGLGCISAQLLGPVNGYAVYMTFSTSSASSTITGWGGGGATINIPQVSNIPTATNQASCAHQVTQSCLLDQVNSCGAGATCRQVIAGSNLGVCINPNQQMYPSNPYGW